MRKTFQAVFYQQAKTDGLSSPDDYTLKDAYFHLPEHDFILCRNKKNIATAIFGGKQWDFSPYATSISNMAIFKFDFLEKTSSSDFCKLNLINEVKKMLFLLIYFTSNQSKTGRMSIKILGNRFQMLKQLALFCADTKAQDISSEVRISDVLSIDTLLVAFTKNLSEYKLSELSHLLINLKMVKSSYLGFVTVDFYKTRKNSKQTPIIPSRIYFLSFSILSEQINKFFKVKDQICDLIKEFNNENYGLSLSTQAKRKLTKDYPTLPELLSKHGLTDFFSGDYKINGISSLPAILADIQITCKFIIHQYTAMRSDEAHRVKYKCIKEVNLSKNKNEEKNELKPNRFINIISSTTKFTGYRQKAGWLCPEQVSQAIEVLRAIVRGIASLFNVKPESLPLFHSTGRITHTASKLGQMLTLQSKKPNCLKDIKITIEDRDELLNSDKSRTFKESQFLVGEAWIFNSHQYRRSLGFFGANSNLVSESTGAQLFKHLNHEMQRYYRRGFNQIRSVLGYLDKETGEITIPPDHFLFEFQTGISVSKAREILNLLLSDNETLYGKRGSYIEKQRNERGLEDDDVMILQLKTETERKVIQGEISYKKTLLGGCMKDGKCPFYMLGEFTACIDCEDAIILPLKLEQQIDNMNEELNNYEEDSAEYQLVYSELLSLTELRNKEQNKRKNHD